nr:tail fiber protein [uncultured Draconibacterium sp.]
MDAFIGEIRAFANNYYPVDWLPCLGQKVLINDYTALFSIIQNYYGESDMRTYFTLPDLRGRTLVGAGGQLSLSLGGKTGEERVTLNSWEIPEHAHSFTSVMSADKPSLVAAPENDGTSYLSNFGYKTDSGTPSTPGYVDEEENPVTLSPLAIAQTGGNLSHENMAPFLAINYYICSDGIYPQRP